MFSDEVLEEERLREEEGIFDVKIDRPDQWQARHSNRFQKVFANDIGQINKSAMTPMTKHIGGYSVAVPRPTKPSKEITPTTASVLPGKQTLTPLQPCLQLTVQRRSIQVRYSSGIIFSVRRYSIL